jgi:hypothetical protein
MAATFSFLIYWSLLTSSILEARFILGLSLVYLLCIRVAALFVHFLICYLKKVGVLEVFVKNLYAWRRSIMVEAKSIL